MRTPQEGVAIATEREAWLTPGGRRIIAVGHLLVDLHRAVDGG